MKLLAILILNLLSTSAFAACPNGTYDEVTAKFTSENPSIKLISPPKQHFYTAYSDPSKPDQDFVLAFDDKKCFVFGSQVDKEQFETWLKTQLK